MAPTPLMTKGTGSLARKWKKIRKRCSSFSSNGDNNASNAALSRSLSINAGDTNDDSLVAIGDLNVTIANPTSTEREMSTFSGLKTRLQQFTEKKRRRSSQERDSVSQWWQWQGAKNDSGNLTTEDNVTLRSCRSRKSVIRTSSLKERKASTNDQDPEDDDVFVRADPVNRGQRVHVKSAIISSTANPYCTTARVPKTSLTGKTSPNRNSTALLYPHRFSSPVKNGSHPDQDSGYDGYCPDKSITSLGSSENASLMSSASSSTSNEESHYGNTMVGFASTAAIYGRISRQVRPQSVYEKQFGPVQHSLSLESPSSSTGSTPPPPLPPSSSSRSQISQATVVNLVTSRISGGIPEEPPPLPPRPASGSLSPDPKSTPPKLPPADLKPHSITQASTSLPRSRRLRKLNADLSQKRTSFHLDTSFSGESSCQQLSLAKIDLNTTIDSPSSIAFKVR